MVGAIQVLRNAVGGGRVSDFPENSVTKMYGSTLLALRCGGWVSDFPENSVTKMYGSTLLALRCGGCRISRKSVM